MSKNSCNGEEVQNLVTLLPPVPIQAGTQIGLIGGILYARMVSHFTVEVESGL